ncbi:HAD family hydrolase [Bacillus ndiopicus]|uniref:HAD family hydrolase n=1 Tax=Bacillus ndiopicus TaxID=1347368 RepID=UPI0005AA315E|nr:HAD family hydrolase [Bacillus ndiopicus]
MYKCIIFDVDGTILDTEMAMLKSLQKVLLEEIGQEHKLESLRFILGIPGRESLKQLEINDVERMLDIWSRKVLEFSDEVSVFSGLAEVIQKLTQSSVKIGIVTSKTRQQMLDEFDHFGLSHFFEVIICADDTEKHKPNPEPLLACLEKLRMNPQHTIYIGDSIYDMQCAKNAGAHFGLALWGSKTTEGFTAEHILTKPTDILKLI